MKPFKAVRDELENRIKTVSKIYILNNKATHFCEKKSRFRFKIFSQFFFTE